MEDWLVENGGRKGYITEGMEEAPENGKESSHFAHANGMNKFLVPKSETSRSNVLMCVITVFRRG
jgi:hypothetical protein